MYRVLLNASKTPSSSMAAKAEAKSDPLDLLCARFFRSHDSFYDLEILSRSLVKSYIVVLKTQVHGRAIQYL